MKQFFATLAAILVAAAIIYFVKDGMDSSARTKASIREVNRDAARARDQHEEIERLRAIHASPTASPKKMNQ